MLCTCSGSGTVDGLPHIPVQPDCILTPAEAQAMQDGGEVAAWVGIGAGAGEKVRRPLLDASHATRTETGFAVRIIVFSTATAMATSPC